LGLLYKTAHNDTKALEIDNIIKIDSYPHK